MIDWNEAFIRRDQLVERLATDIDPDEYGDLDLVTIAEGLLREGWITE